VFCAILYVLKTACQWRMLPSDFPSLRTVYEYFRIWSNRKDGENQSLLEALLTEIVGDLRLIDGRQQKTSTGLLMHFVKKIAILLFSRV
jgi:transposase